MVTTTATGVTSGCVRSSTQSTDASCQGGHYRQHIPQGPRPGSSQTLSSPVVSCIGDGLNRGSQASVVFNPVVHTVNKQANLQGSPQGVQGQHNPQPLLSQQQCPIVANPHSQCMCGSGRVVTQISTLVYIKSAVIRMNISVTRCCWGDACTV